MNLGKFLKQPNEYKDYDIDFRPWLEPIDDTLDDVDISVECIDDPNDQKLTFERPTITEDFYKIWAKGGTSGYVYKLTLLVFTAGGRRDESEVYFVVEDL